GLDRYECRKAVLRDLEEGGYLVKTEDHEHNVGTCYRCGTTVEPMTSAQWFVKMAPLAKPAMDVVHDGRVKFVPGRFANTYLRWMENVHDWCISRQLWWGHRIPAYYCEDCGEMTVAKEDVTVCPKCGGTHIHQEEDVLDTWFSSALWPFSTLGWPEKTRELDYFYPTSVLVTGYDIIFFWVARMIFSGMEQMHEEPFKTVYIHGLVRDAQGRKMSKSLGNGIDPLEIIEQYGADALRFTLVTGNSPGNDMRFSTEKVEASRNFANKIWNASRFIQMNLTIDNAELPADLALEDKWILHKYNELVKAVTENIDKYELGIAVQKLYDFIWDNFCDWYIEIVKPRLQNHDDVAANERAQKVLCYVLRGTMQLLHPFMPFITESIWQALPHEGPSIMVSKWPEYQTELCFAAEAEQVETMMDTIRAIRARRAEMNVPPSKRAQVILLTDERAAYEAGILFFSKLAYASEVIFADAMPENADSMVSVVTKGATAYMPMGELIDFEKERERLNKEKAKVQKDLDFVNKKLNNPGFVAKAPAAVVEQEREKVAKLEELMAKLDASLAALK
ncbi:valine--tRNA ligase, partial [Butyricicoccus pullicaecorum]